MKAWFGLLALSFFLAACGRTSMDPCAVGAEDCGCTAAGACNAGLVCSGGICQVPAALAGSGGQLGGGGRVGTGGIPGGGGFTGGRTGTGGQPAAGGYGGGGGRVGTGGAGSGGLSAGSGGSGRGGTLSLGGTTGAVTFYNGQAVGAMTGYGWVGLGPKDSLASPTCSGKPITSSEACASTMDWQGSGLCVTGIIPALPPGPSIADYNDNWGIMVSANASLEGGATLGRPFQTVIFNLTGFPTSGLRAVVHRKWDQDSYNYCATMTSGARLSFLAFNSECWDGSGTPLRPEDVAQIDWVGVQVPSTMSAINVGNLCLMGILFE